MPKNRSNNKGIPDENKNPPPKKDSGKGGGSEKEAKKAEGASKKLGKALSTLKDRLSKVAEAVKSKLTKALSKLSETLKAKAGNAIGKLTKTFQKGATAASKVGGAFTKFGAAIQAIGGFLPGAVGKLGGFTSTLSSFVRKVSPAHAVRLNLAFSRVMATIGAKLIPFTVKFTNFLQRLAGWIDKIPSKAFSFWALIAVIGVLVGIIILALTPFFLLIAAIGAVIAAIVAVIGFFMTMAIAVITIVGMILGIIITIGGFILGLISFILNNIPMMIIRFAGMLFNILRFLWGGVVNIVGGIIKFVISGVGFLINIFGSLITTIIQVGVQAGQLIAQMVSLGIKFLINMFKALGFMGSIIAVGVAMAVASMGIGPLIGLIVELATTFSDKLSGMFNKVKEFFKGIYDWITGIFQKVKDFFVGIAQKFKGIFDPIIKIAEKVYNYVVNVIKKIWEKITAAFRWLFGSKKQEDSGGPGLPPAAQDAMDQLNKMMGEMKDSLKDLDMGKMTDKLGEGLGNITDKFKELGDKMGITQMLDNLGGPLQPGEGRGKAAVAEQVSTGSVTDMLNKAMQSAFSLGGESSPEEETAKNTSQQVPMLGDMKDKIGDLAGNMKNMMGNLNLGDMVGSLKETMGGMTEKLKSALPNPEELKSKFQAAFQKGAGGDLQGLAKENERVSDVQQQVEKKMPKEDVTAKMYSQVMQRVTMIETRLTECVTYLYQTAANTYGTYESMRTISEVAKSKVKNFSGYQQSKYYQNKDTGQETI
jgi:phage-related protein